LPTLRCKSEALFSTARLNRSSMLSGMGALPKEQTSGNRLAK
jgi:hypothetical protein